MRRQCCIAGRRRPVRDCAQRVASARSWPPRGTCSRGAHRLAEHPARLFVCARCRAQVLLCSRCDRGRRYCGRACSRAARDDSRRQIARRYQCSRAGRIAHAARSRRWRQQHRPWTPPDRGDAQTGVDIDNFVTHQGSPAAGLGAPLPSCEQATEPGAINAVANAAPIAARCRRCASALSPWARQGFLRHARASRWPAGVVDPCG
jgi:hypothetical protein